MREFEYDSIYILSYNLFVISDYKIMKPAYNPLVYVKIQGN
jgi:hypothetical protein